MSHRAKDPESQRSEISYKRINVAVEVGDKTFRFAFKAAPHCGYTSSFIELELDRVVEYIDEKFPRLEFRRVDLGPSSFKYIACGARKAVTNATTTSEGSEGSEVRRDGESDQGAG